MPVILDYGFLKSSEWGLFSVMFAVGSSNSSCERILTFSICQSWSPRLVRFITGSFVSCPWTWAKHAGILGNLSPGPAAWQVEALPHWRGYFYVSIWLGHHGVSRYWLKPPPWCVCGVLLHVATICTGGLGTADGPPQPGLASSSQVKACMEQKWRACMCSLSLPGCLSCDTGPLLGSAGTKTPALWGLQLVDWGLKWSASRLVWAGPSQ